VGIYGGYSLSPQIIPLFLASVFLIVCFVPFYVLFISAASNFGLGEDMLGNPPRWIALGFQWVYFNQKVFAGLGFLDHKVKPRKYCRLSGKQLTCPSNKLFQLYDGKAGIGSRL